MQYVEVFDSAFQERFLELLELRRDVRRFKSDPLPEGTIEELVRVSRYTPSVGYSQPWRFVQVRSPQRRQAVVESFERANAAALATYHDEDARLYASLKLSGLREAPEHVAIFCDESTKTGKGLGANTMPEALQYSTAMAIYTFWLAARTRGVGVGWVSILEPDVVQSTLAVPMDWCLVAYLCVGYPTEYAAVPELRRLGWEDIDERSVEVLQR